MVSGPQSPIWVSLIHVCQLLTHVMAWDHGHVLNSKGQEDVLL